MKAGRVEYPTGFRQRILYVHPNIVAFIVETDRAGYVGSRL
jgi:hypothetical protein